MRIYHLHVFFIVKINQTYNFLFFYNISLLIVVSFQSQLCFQRFLRSCDRSPELSSLVCSCNVFLLFEALSLVVLVLLVSCMFASMIVASRKEHSSRVLKMKIEMHEQVLKTLSSYYMDLRQVYSLIMFYPNNFIIRLHALN